MQVLFFVICVLAAILLVAIVWYTWKSIHQKPETAFNPPVEPAHHTKVSPKGSEPVLATNPTESDQALNIDDLNRESFVKRQASVAANTFFSSSVRQ
ncbi:MAG: hypothetical protein LBE31_11455 [Deltaproteobacteria bacterium]|jgi:hypothetical protein|nr:hypothetical protein [Deltaproteobacteria bacterium]